MSKPVFKIGGTDFTTWLEELEPVREDMDSDEAGRNLLDGLMYRARIAQKKKWRAKFLRLPAPIMKDISKAIGGEFAQITFLDPDTDRVITKEYYTSTLNYGAQKYSRSDEMTVYDGCNFNMTER